MQLPAGGKQEPGRHDPDDGVRLAVERNRLFEDARIRAETPDPECVADDGHLVAAGLILCFIKGAASFRRDADG